MSKKNPCITKEQINKLKAGSVRKDKKAQGFFDGRFVTRTEESKKVYNRTKKHKGNADN